MKKLDKDKEDKRNKLYKYKINLIANICVCLAVIWDMISVINICSLRDFCMAVALLAVLVVLFFCSKVDKMIEILYENNRFSNLCDVTVVSAILLFPIERMIPFFVERGVYIQLLMILSVLLALILVVCIRGKEKGSNYEEDIT